MDINATQKQLPADEYKWKTKLDRWKTSDDQIWTLIDKIQCDTCWDGSFDLWLRNRKTASDCFSAQPLSDCVQRIDDLLAEEAEEVKKQASKEEDNANADKDDKPPEFEKTNR